jgi:hypothetical protein
MKIRDITESTYNPSEIYLHGGPGPNDLTGGALKRYGREHSDMGALFFTSNTPDGMRYALGYTLAKPNGGVYQCRIKIPPNKMFDFSKTAHRNIARQNLNPQEFNGWVESARANHLDWTSVDDELMEEWGFRGAIFFERPKGHNGFKTNVLSFAVFHAEDVEIIGFTPKEELLKTMQP